MHRCQRCGRPVAYVYRGWCRRCWARCGSQPGAVLMDRTVYTLAVCWWLLAAVGLGLWVYLAMWWGA